ncbi:MAG: AraC family transcriptional regulator [Prolixibacteraceae bacterium]|nr:AraC family transcriptional regulator [Prolixibacteraceae bacterium]
MKKQDGFPGQLSYVIPDRILSIMKQNPLCCDLYITDIGYYPQARHHFRERRKGIDQTILIYATEGKGSIIVNDQKYQLEADHFFIIPEGVPHAYFADLQNPWSIYWIHFAGSKSDHYSKYAFQTWSIEKSKTSRTSDRFDLFSEIFRNLDRGFGIETVEYANQCLPHLLASFTHLNQFRLIKETGEKDQVSLSINFMLENIRQTFSLEELAKNVNLSTSHYSRLFSARTGHSPINYFIQLKIQRSCRLLDNSTQSIADIAREMGFDDQFYFSRQFRKVMSMSPREYRNRGRVI